VRNQGKEWATMPRKIKRDVLEAIGGTPLVKLSKLPGKGSAAVFAKVESLNPGGSVKDRIAWSMVLDAERKGLLSPGGTLVEPTSGNTGIGLAMVGAVRGYRVILVMTDSISFERYHLLRSFGAEVVFSPAERGMQGAVELAESMVVEHPEYFMPQQFNNPANPEIHRRTTAREILSAMGDDPIHAFVAGVGTGGTITGVGEVLKGKYPQMVVVAVEPAASPVLSGGLPAAHKIEGIGAGFVPKVLNTQILDETIGVDDDEAYDMAQRLACEEGLLVGVSAGAACAAALQVAKRLGPKKQVVFICPDRGERYFSLKRYFRAGLAELRACSGPPTPHLYLTDPRQPH
jgi:cysteine synthase A